MTDSELLEGGHPVEHEEKVVDRFIKSEMIVREEEVELKTTRSGEGAGEVNKEVDLSSSPATPKSKSRKSRRKKTAKATGTGGSGGVEAKSPEASEAALAAGPGGENKPWA